jgi:hypothetical protein
MQQRATLAQTSLSASRARAGADALKDLRAKLKISGWIFGEDLPAPVRSLEIL